MNLLVLVEVHVLSCPRPSVYANNVITVHTHPLTSKWVKISPDGFTRPQPSISDHSRSHPSKYIHARSCQYPPLFLYLSRLFAFTSVRSPIRHYTTKFNRLLWSVHEFTRPCGSPRPFLSTSIRLHQHRYHSPHASVASSHVQVGQNWSGWFHTSLRNVHNRPIPTIVVHSRPSTSILVHVCPHPPLLVYISPRTPTPVKVHLRQSRYVHTIFSLVHAQSSASKSAILS